MSSLSRLQKLRHLELNLPLTSSELPKVNGVHRNPPWGMSGEPVQWPAPEISADYCKELFNHMLGEQEKFLDSVAAENRAPFRMLVIKVGECESFNYYSNRPSKYKYMWICRRINDGLLEDVVCERYEFWISRRAIRRCLTIS